MHINRGQMTNAWLAAQPNRQPKM